MELTMGQREAVTAVIARRYEQASKAKKGLILDELCATTGWHRSHARKALRAALVPAMVPARRVRPPIYGPREVAALRTCWIVLGTPAGKRLAPFLPEIVNRLRAQGELDLSDELAASLTRMSAATIDRRLAPERAKLRARGRSHTKPGSLLKDAIPIRTWAEWDDAVPGFVEIDLVAHEGGNNAGRFASTLTVTDIATGWTENRTVRSKGRQWVFAALLDISACFPFPIKGIDSDNGGEFINYQLLTYCEQHHITFTRSRPGNKNDGAHAEQKNWSVVRQLVGYHRYDTDAEQDLLNQLWAEQSLMTNYFGPQQKLISKVRRGAKITKT
jgi:Integrase core domain